MNNFKVGDIVKTRTNSKMFEILKIDGSSAACRNTVTDELGWYLLDQLLPPKRTREVTVYVNVLKHDGIEWNTTHDSYAVAKYSTTILDHRIEVLAVAVPVTFTVEW